jgi:iron(III) transport system permease protein
VRDDLTGHSQDYALLWGLVLAVAVLSLLPLARLLIEGIAPNGQLSTAVLRDVLSRSSTWTAAQHSLLTALGGTALAVIVGSSVAFVVALTDVRARNTFVFCFVLPMMIAPQVVALAWLQLFGPSSPLLQSIGLAPALGTRNPL